MVLVAPSVKRIVLPRQTVVHKLLVLPRGIPAAVGFAGSHDLTQVLAQVRSHTGLVVGGVSQPVTAVGGGVGQQRGDLQRVVLLFGQEACLLHLFHDHRTARQGFLGAPDRVEQSRVLQHAYQHGGFLDVHLIRSLAEIDVARRTDADGVVAEIELVQIHVDDFLLGVEGLELDGNHPFNRFLHHASPESARGLFRIELFGQLLRDGRTAASR